MIGSFIEILYRAFPLSSDAYRLYQFYQLFPNISEILGNLLFFIIILFLSLILFNLLNYLEKQFYKSYTNFELKRFDNYIVPEEHIHVLMNYKIINLKYSIIKILLYMVPIISFFIVWRILRLGLEVNVIEIYNSFKSLPLLFEIEIIILFLMYILIIKKVVNNINIRLHFELKKLYIYCCKYGNKLDPNSFIYFSPEYYEKYSSEYYVDDSYLHTYFMNVLFYRFSPYKFKLFLYFLYGGTLSQIKDELLFITPFLIPFIYLLRISKFSKTILAFYIRDFIKFLNENFLTILKIIPWILLLLIFLSDMYCNNFIIYKTYYALFIIYIYNQYINLCYFYNGVPMQSTVCDICMYYYKMEDLKQNNLYGEHLRSSYEWNTQKGFEKGLLLVLITGLDCKQTSAIYNNTIGLDKTKIELWYIRIIKTIKDFKIIKEILEINKNFELKDED